MDNISRIEIFLNVVKHESFSASARELGMTGSAVSKQVQNLEDYLGVKLLNRTTRKVSLTSEGAMYFDKASYAVENLNNAKNEIQDLRACPTGKLKINTPMSFGINYLTKPLAEFAKKYPDLDLDIDFDDRNVDVISEGYDAVIRIGALKDSSLIARKLKECPLILCASKEYIKEHGMPEAPEDLKNHELINYTRHNNRSEWRYTNANGDNKFVEIPSSFSANNGEMMLDATLDGLAMSILPIFLAHEHLASGQLIRVLEGYETYPQRNIYAIFPQNRYISTKVRLFVEFICEYCKKLDW